MEPLTKIVNDEVQRSGVDWKSVSPAKKYEYAEQHLQEALTTGRDALLKDENRGFISKAWNTVWGSYSVEKRVDYLLGENQGFFTWIRNNLTDSWNQLKTDEMAEIKKEYETLQTEEDKQNFRYMLAGYIEAEDRAHAVMRNLYSTTGTIKRGIGAVAAGAALTGLAVVTGGASLALAPYVIGALTVTIAASAAAVPLEEYITGLYAKMYGKEGDRNAAGQTYDAAFTLTNAALNTYVTAGITNLVNTRTESKYAIYSMHEGSKKFLDAWRSRNNPPPARKGILNIVDDKEQIPVLHDYKSEELKHAA